MDTILVKPKTKEDLELVFSLLNKMNVPSLIQKKENQPKKKAKAAFLDSLPSRLNEVKLHMEGKIKLKSWDELYHEL